MGQNVNKQSFSPEDFVQFKQRLHQQLDELKLIMARPNFGQASLKLGAELELYLTDSEGHCQLSNQQVLAKLHDSVFQHEINQYNLELNVPPVSLDDKAFSHMAQQMNQRLIQLNDCCRDLGTHATAIGILPTLRPNDLLKQNMTDLERYHILVDQLKINRGAPFQIDIHGEEDVHMQVEDVTAEGANTSFQVHMMVPPGAFVDVYNAAMLSQALVTAASGNSPIFLGKVVWDETRIALLKQVLDCRVRDLVARQLPARVNLGLGWLKQSAWSLYAEAVALYPVLLPNLFPAHQGEGLPELSELCLHMGTVWNWHRPVYCHQATGHIRIEFRALPAGPTVEDMVANAAFSVGLAYGLSQQMEAYSAIMPFEIVDNNFYRAAQHGLNASIYWPDVEQYHVTHQPIKQVVLNSLEIAKTGLILLGICNAEAEHYLAIIQRRVEQNATGANWQKAALHYFEQTQHRHYACIEMLKFYQQQSVSGAPVHQWERPWQ
ncbi:glutamate-cysteine ligase family protein [Catenovulum agarivorans]|uniref:glutamate-cysteine ligase family protein n=1 Tax=Catenovulum agarivorans TaxID=1172192 RepID=UPI0002F37B84|nr:glutamate-cysteine ligase family protein [Catenovulum agarivorans]